MDPWKTENAYKILVGKPEGERPLGRTRRIKKGKVVPVPN
jgi:hypothetical protein